MDSNWAEDTNDRKSQSRFAFIYSNGAIAWESRKQSIVATSSAEAEYVALTSAAKEAAYFKHLLTEMNIHPGDKPIAIYNDSQSAQFIAHYQGRHSRTKDLHIRYHYIREAVADRIVELNYLPTKEMPADALTKPTTASSHYYCFKNLGMKF